MSAEILREAAQQIRADWQRDADYWEGRPSGTARIANTWVAVADLLDHVASLRESAPTVLGKVASRVTGYEDQVDTIARIYLGRADA